MSKLKLPSASKPHAQAKKIALHLKATLTISFYRLYMPQKSRSRSKPSNRILKAWFYDQSKHLGANSNPLDEIIYIEATRLWQTHKRTQQPTPLDRIFSATSRLQGLAPIRLINCTFLSQCASMWRVIRLQQIWRAKLNAGTNEHRRYTPCRDFISLDPSVRNKL